MKSLYDRFASSEDGGQLLAAARLRREVLRILHRALEASGLTQSQLAERLQIRKSAVSQVFRGDGNLRVTTLAVYLNTMGYELDIRAVEAGEPRKAVLEGREMVPALKQDWVESEPDEATRAIVSSANLQHDAFVHVATAALQLHFTSSLLTTMLVEMRMDPTGHAGGSLYDFRGTAETTLPSISATQEFHPIRSEATS